jgi:energy-coupling factor transporter ATP-binding protein EcfA2
VSGFPRRVCALTTTSPPSPPRSLELYARIKGVAEGQLRAVVEKQLSDFDLRDYAAKLAGTLSGGNKRKLSVAIALIGDPPVVFLDEPSTGVDPVARRFMWGVIARVAAADRGGTSIILTTHSMEEVEALCTRIGIMVGGRLRCLGTSQHLKSTHGAGFLSEVRLAPPQLVVQDGFVVAIREALEGADVVPAAALPALFDRLGCAARMAEVRSDGAGWQISSALAARGAVAARDLALFLAEEEAVASLLRALGIAFPGAALAERQGLVLRVKIPPQQGASLAQMFGALEAARRPCAIASYTLSQTSLEALFNSFAAMQEEERGVARGTAAGAAAAPAAAAVVQDWRLGGRRR